MVKTSSLSDAGSNIISMKSTFGRGFMVVILHLARHFALPPEQAFYGAADHLTEMIIPEQFRGTEIEKLCEQLRKRVIWHQPGVNDREDAEDVIRILKKLALAVDRELGIKDADIGRYD
ncbi:MAG: hypothetical protein ACXQTG_02695 [Methanoculleaceae archaeon]